MNYIIIEAVTLYLLHDFSDSPSHLQSLLCDYPCPASSQYALPQVTLGSKSLLSLGPQIWNALPKEIKLAENIQTFKRMVKQWDGSTCNCNICN